MFVNITKTKSDHFPNRDKSLDSEELSYKQIWYKDEDKQYLKESFLNLQ